MPRPAPPAAHPACPEGGAQPLRLPLPAPAARLHKKLAATSKNWPLQKRQKRSACRPKSANNTRGMPCGKYAQRSGLKGGAMAAYRSAANFRDRGVCCLPAVRELKWGQGPAERGYRRRYGSESLHSKFWRQGRKRPSGCANYEDPSGGKAQRNELTGGATAANRCTANSGDRAGCCRPAVRGLRCRQGLHLALAPRQRIASRARPRAGDFRQESENRNLDTSSDGPLGGTARSLGSRGQAFTLGSLCRLPTAVAKPAAVRPRRHLKRRGHRLLAQQETYRCLQRIAAACIRNSESVRCALGPSGTDRLGGTPAISPSRRPPSNLAASRC